MKARKLTAQLAIRLLERFYFAAGAEQCLASYSWDHPPQQPPGKVYEFSDDKIPPDRADELRDAILEVETAPQAVAPASVVGFGIINLNTKDAQDTEAVLWVGVFPGFRRLGYRVKIMDWLADRARQLGADTASFTVNKLNKEHYDRAMRESHSEGSKWVYAGDHFKPAPGYGYWFQNLTEED